MAICSWTKDVQKNESKYFSKFYGTLQPCYILGLENKIYIKKADLFLPKKMIKLYSIN
jgi:hypothetical protein